MTQNAYFLLLRCTLSILLVKFCDTNAGIGAKFTKTHGWTDRRTNGRTAEGWTNGRTNVPTNGRTNVLDWPK